MTTSSTSSRFGGELVAAARRWFDGRLIDEEARLVVVDDDGRRDTRDRLRDLLTRPAEHERHGEYRPGDDSHAAGNTEWL